MGLIRLSTALASDITALWLINIPSKSKFWGSKAVLLQEDVETVSHHVGQIARVNIPEKLPGELKLEMLSNIDPIDFRGLLEVYL